MLERKINSYIVLLRLMKLRVGGRMVPHLIIFLELLLLLQDLLFDDGCDGSLISLCQNLFSKDSMKAKLIRRITHKLTGHKWGQKAKGPEMKGKCKSCSKEGKNIKAERGKKEKKQPTTRRSYE